MKELKEKLDKKFRPYCFSKSRYLDTDLTQLAAFPIKIDKNQVKILFFRGK